MIHSKVHCNVKISCVLNCKNNVLCLTLFNFNKILPRNIEIPITNTTRRINTTTLIRTFSRITYPCLIHILKNTTTSTTFTDIDAAFELTITTTGGAILFGSTLSFYANGGVCYLDISVDGTRIGGDDGLFQLTNGFFGSKSFFWLIEGEDAGEHDIKLVWRVAAGTTTLYALDGGGTDLPGQIWIREF